MNKKLKTRKLKELSFENWSMMEYANFEDFIKDYPLDKNHEYYWEHDGYIYALNYEDKIYCCVKLK